MDSVWCDFGAALVSIRIQFGLGLDLNWVIKSLEIGFNKGYWCQIGFGFVLALDWIHARPFSINPKYIAFTPIRSTVYKPMNFAC